MLQGRPLDHLLERRREVLEDDDRRRTRILQLVFELARRIQRVDVDAGVARAQHAAHRDGELRHVGQHDGHARAGLQATRLQPCAHRLRQRVEFAIRHPSFHAHRKRPLGVARE